MEKKEYFRKSIEFLEKKIIIITKFYQMFTDLE